MKILYLCPDQGIPVLGRKGASVHVRELVAAFARAGHKVTLAAQTLNKLSGEKPAKVKASVIHVPLPPAAEVAAQSFKDFNQIVRAENSMPGELRRILYNRELEMRLKRRLATKAPDFIYERASLYATVGVALARHFCVPLIVELNAPLAVEHTAYRDAGLGKLALEAEQWSLSRADAVVVVSTELAKHVKSLGVRPGKIHVMPNGVNPALFYPPNGRAGSPLPAERTHSKDGAHPPMAGRPTLGFVGGLRPWHGVEILPELLARLKKRYPGVRLVIAGDGQLRSELVREFKKRKLQKNVVITGLLQHEELPAVIRQFDIALAPYPKTGHAFYFSPLKLFEYMACGVPVVAAKLGQIAEIVRDGKTGLLYAPGNLNALVSQCEKLLANPKLGASLGRAAAKVVHEKFTWDNNAMRVTKLARSLAASRRK